MRVRKRPALSIRFLAPRMIGSVLLFDSVLRVRERERPHTVRCSLQGEARSQSLPRKHTYTHHSLCLSLSVCPSARLSLSLSLALSRSLSSLFLARSLSPRAQVMELCGGESKELSRLEILQREDLESD
eukprot:3161372-Rhodomonas_salina.1